MLGILLLSTAVLFALSSTAELTCFYPDGTTSEPNHTPCNLTIGASACCDPADSCSTSGLCLGRTGFTYRGSCTDKTWTSGNCPGACRSDPFDKVAYSATTPLLSCDKPGSPPSDFCCNSPTRNCCTIATFIYGNTGFAFNPGMDLLLKELSDAQNLARAESMPSNATAHPPPGYFSGQNNLSMCLTSATTIGIAVGAPLGALVIGVISFLFWREKRNERLYREREAKSEGGGDGSVSGSGGRGRERPQAIMMDLDPLAKDRPYYFNPGPPPKPPVEPMEDYGYKSPVSRSGTMTSMSARSNTLTTRIPPPVTRTRMERVDRKGNVDREPESVNELI